MNKSIVVKAPGKIILSGEHSVVYGKEAIAFSIGLFTYTSLNPDTSSQNLQIHLPSLNIKRSYELQLLEEYKDSLQETTSSSSVDMKSNEMITLLDTIDKRILYNEEKIVQLALKIILVSFIITGKLAKKKNACGLNIEWTSEFPISAGLGSSASFAVTMVTSFLVYYHLISESQSDWSKDDYHMIKYLANQMEVITHGTPSGIDATIATFGYGLIFKQGDFELLEKLQNLPFDILIVHTNQERSTKDLVTRVRQNKEKLNELYDSLLEAMNQTTMDIKKELFRLTNGDSTDSSIFEHLIEINQHLLECIGVSHPTITTISTICATYGLKCKLTGAGGGGCVIIIVPKNFAKEKLVQLRSNLKSNNFESWFTKIGCEGVTLMNVNAT